MGCYREVWSKSSETLCSHWDCGPGSFLPKLSTLMSTIPNECWKALIDFNQTSPGASFRNHSSPIHSGACYVFIIYSCSHCNMYSIGYNLQLSAFFLTFSWARIKSPFQFSFTIQPVFNMKWSQSFLKQQKQCILMTNCTMVAVGDCFKVSKHVCFMDHAGSSLWMMVC